MKVTWADTAKVGLIFTLLSPEQLRVQCQHVYPWELTNLTRVNGVPSVIL